MIVEVVNDVLVPVIWPDMDELRVCMFFLIGIRSCVDNLGLHIISDTTKCTNYAANTS